MRLHLVSLALLLLALCRPSSAAVDWTVVHLESGGYSYSFIASEDKANLEGKIGSTTEGITSSDAAGKAKLIAAIPNFILAQALVEAGLADKIPSFWDAAIENGMLCEAAQTANIDELKKALYGGVAKYKFNEEKTTAKGLTPAQGGPIDCDSSETKPDALADQDCFCTKQQGLVYCFMQRTARNITRTKKTCRSDALAALKVAGTTELGKMYDLDDSYSKKPAFQELFDGKDEDGINKITHDADQAYAGLFCDAIDPKVEKAVQDLYASDGLYWFLEGTLYTLLFGPSQKTFVKVCEEDAAFKASKYGECVCKMDTGFTFCIYKVLADYFVQKEFLKCDPTKPNDALLNKIIPDKKPKELPKAMLVKAAKAADVTTTPTNATETTTAGPPDSAATSSLLLAAAVVLLGQ